MAGERWVGIGILPLYISRQIRSSGLSFCVLPKMLSSCLFVLGSESYGAVTLIRVFHGLRGSLDFAITTPRKVNVEEAPDVN